MKMTIRQFIMVVILTFGSIPSVFAVLNITGTYSGTISGNDSSCTLPTDDGPFSGVLTVTFVGDAQGNISSGSGTFFDNSDGKTDGISNISGANTDTSFVFAFTTSDGSFTSAPFSGTINGSSLIITGGQVAGGPDGCVSNISGGTLTKTSGSVVASKNTPSSTITDAILFNTQMQSIVSGLSSHIGAALAGFFSFGPKFGDNQFTVGGMTGLNAGDDSQIPYGIWGNYSYSDYENDLSTTAFEGVSHSFLGGIDFRLWESAILGIAFGYDNSDIDTTFNGGNQNTDSFTFAPYFGAMLNDTLSVDVNVGYTNVQYDQYRTATTTRVTSSPRADRWFGAFNLNATKYIDNWILGGRVGALYATSVIDGYTESNGTIISAARSKVGTASIAGDIAYGYKNFEPFLNLSYQYDYALQDISSASNPQPTNDKDDILMTLGVRYFEDSGISGNLEYSKRFERDNFSEDRLSLTVRVDY